MNPTKIPLIKATVKILPCDPEGNHFAYMTLQATNSMMMILNEEDDPRKRQFTQDTIEDIIASDLEDLHYYVMQALSKTSGQEPEYVEDAKLEILYSLTENNEVEMTLDIQSLFEFASKMSNHNRTELERLDYLAEIFPTVTAVSQVALADLLCACIKSKESKQTISTN